jgi:uncharacterized protein
MPVKRKEMLLAVLAAVEGKKLSPTQLQKALFLITKNIPDAFAENELYEFEPYNYGPFDVKVYRDAEINANNGPAEITLSPSGRWKEYSASNAGVLTGKSILSDLTHSQRLYIENVSNWVKGLNFEKLVKSIYDTYPEMKVNSVFKG